MNKYIIKLSKKSAYSYTIVVPKEIVEKYGWRAKQKLVIKDKGNGLLTIRDWRAK